MSDYPLRPPLECDLVMKGGVTSGVIYPSMIADLATTYRLRSIGGSSAGAIAAAAAAAAEYGRASGGFDRLAALPSSLAASGSGGRSLLAGLFQADRQNVRVFALLTAVLGARGAWQRVRAAVVAGLRGFWVAALPGLVPGLVVAALGLASGTWAGGVAGALGGVLLALLLVPLAVLIAVVRATSGMEGFGLCSGMPPSASSPEQAPSLTPWLHEQLQTLAGRTVDDRPLTFGDLRRRGITLRMMTTNLTQGQPMTMPWASREYFFDPAELRALFPAPVVDAMVAPVPAEQLRAGLVPWPSPDDLPVLVATRMSLSFPGLIAAVRLHAVNYGLPGRSLEPVWFSDGGICSNLPVHLFDAPLPTRPTFAINLDPYRPGGDKDVYLADDAGDGRWRPWHAIDGFASFGLGILSAARGWVDERQMTMPGYRGRIVSVFQRPGEGGLNLDMPASVLTGLSDRGRDAARLLLDHFAGDAPGEVEAAGWARHRWARMRIALAGYSRWVTGFAAAYDDPPAAGVPYPSWLGPGASAVMPSYQLPRAERAVLDDRVADLAAAGRLWSDGAALKREPKPAPVLRLVPDLDPAQRE